jgi:hypothetical protein
LIVAWPNDSEQHVGGRDVVADHLDEIVALLGDGAILP